MICPNCRKEIIDSAELEYTATFGLCLSCDHVLLDRDDQLCDRDTENDPADYIYEDIPEEGLYSCNYAL